MTQEFHSWVSVQIKGAGVLSCVQLFATSQNVAPQAPLYKGFSRQEQLSWLPFSSLGDVPDSGIEPPSPVSPALAGRLFTTEPPEKTLFQANENTN